MTDKEKIDYKIAAKRAARDKEATEWGCSGIIAILFMLTLAIIYKGCF